MKNNVENKPQILSLDKKTGRSTSFKHMRDKPSGSLPPRENSFSVPIQVNQAGIENVKNIDSPIFFETKDSTQ